MFYWVENGEDCLSEVDVFGHCGQIHFGLWWEVVKSLELFSMLDFLDSESLETLDDFHEVVLFLDGSNQVHLHQELPIDLLDVESGVS